MQMPLSASICVILGASKGYACVHSREPLFGIEHSATSNYERFGRSCDIMFEKQWISYGIHAEFIR